MDENQYFEADILGKIFRMFLSEMFDQTIFLVALSMWKFEFYVQIFKGDDQQTAPLNNRPSNPFNI